MADELGGLRVASFWADLTRVFSCQPKLTVDLTCNHAPGGIRAAGSGRGRSNHGTAWWSSRLKLLALEQL
jgi:hypothetical protein